MTFKSLICWFFSHKMKRIGEPRPSGEGTMAPYPAIDEYEQEWRCQRCGKTMFSYAGFIFEDTP